MAKLNCVVSVPSLPPTPPQGKTSLRRGFQEAVIAPFHPTKGGRERRKWSEATRIMPENCVVVVFTLASLYEVMQEWRGLD